MTLTQQVITIALCALGTMATRFLPFLLFSSRKPTPGYIQYLGKALPAAIFGMLVVYCLKMSASYQQPRSARIGCHTCCSGTASMETPNALVNCRWYDLLYASCTVYFLNTAPLPCYEDIVIRFHDIVALFRKNACVAQVIQQTIAAHSALCMFSVQNRLPS